ncbi:MAG TPA: sigma-70 family RNA polymerase sigma factor [Mycobacteriales bacterium]|nr:sigma-70 family RNA polymerase sigma factor [Mycobacteriales bacterium]
MDDGLTEQFERKRDHLRAVAYRMLGSAAEADDAVQEAWLRLNRSDVDGVDNLGGWLTTVVGRICLDMLRSRKARGEDSLDAHVPDPIVTLESDADPEAEAVLADSVGLALLVVLDTLAPAERLAFVLHDMFGVPFDEIAPILGRSVAASKQLASRGRRRVRGAAPAPDADVVRQRRIVDAFLAAAREGDFEALVTLLDPEVVLRADTGTAGSQVVRGAGSVVRQALRFSRLASTGRRVLVNGVPGLISVREGGRVGAVLAFSIVNGRITQLDILADPERLVGVGMA